MLWTPWPTGENQRQQLKGRQPLLKLCLLSKRAVAAADRKTLSSHLDLGYWDQMLPTMLRSDRLRPQESGL